MIQYIYGLVEDCSNSSALAVELVQSCTKPSISYISIHWGLMIKFTNAYSLNVLT